MKSKKKKWMTVPLYREDDTVQKYRVTWGMAPYYESITIVESADYKTANKAVYEDRKARFPQHKYYLRLWEDERRNLIEDYGSYTHFYCYHPIFE